MQEIAKYSGCFVCGDKNLHGLQAKFHFDGEQALCTVTARGEFEGYKNIFHGGIISTLLDEVMIKAILARNEYVVTAEMTVKFKRPVTIGQELRFSGRITSSKGRLFFTDGRAVDAEGTVYAEAVGTYLRAKPDLAERLLDSLSD